MKYRTMKLLAGTALLFTVVSCGSEADDVSIGDEAEQTTEPEETTEPAETDEAPAQPEEEEPMTQDAPASPQVDFALADLSERLSVPVEEIEVFSVEEVDWPDGSLGCPQPDMSYTQAIVNGSKIVLRAGGIQYPYHAAAGQDPFYCAPGQAVSK